MKLDKLGSLKSWCDKTFSLCYPIKKTKAPREFWYEEKLNQPGVVFLSKNKCKYRITKSLLNSNKESQKLKMCTKIFKSVVTCILKDDSWTILHQR